MSLKGKKCYDENFPITQSGNQWIVVRKMPSPKVIFTGDTEEQANAFLVFYLTLPIERRRLLREALA